MPPVKSEKGPWWASLNKSFLNSFLTGTNTQFLNLSLPSLPILKCTTLPESIFCLNHSHWISFLCSSKIWDRWTGFTTNSANNALLLVKVTLARKDNKAAKVFYSMYQLLHLVFLDGTQWLDHNSSTIIAMFFGVGSDPSWSSITWYFYDQRRYDIFLRINNVSRVLVLAQQLPFLDRP